MALPRPLLQSIGRAQARHRWLRPLVSTAGRGVVSGEGVIQHGVGRGLRFDATGGYPGYLLGTSEPAEQQLLSDQLGPGDVFYDIGANIGFYATIAARLVGPTGHVYAFEPGPLSAAYARANALRNGFENVTVVESAVSDQSGVMKLDISPAPHSFRLSSDAVDGIEVSVVTIDEWRQRTGAAPPSLVMLDVEGAELRVLDGMRELLIEHQPTIVCEVHWLGPDFSSYCADSLAPLGYSLQALEGEVRNDISRWHAVLTPSR